jgi:hypothetical protein
MRPNDAEMQISEASSPTLTWCELSEKQLRRRVRPANQRPLHRPAFPFPAQSHRENLQPFELAVAQARLLKGTVRQNRPAPAGGAGDGEAAALPLLDAAYAIWREKVHFERLERRSWPPHAIGKRQALLMAFRWRSLSSGPRSRHLLTTGPREAAANAA